MENGEERDSSGSDWSEPASPQLFASSHQRTPNPDESISDLEEYSTASTSPSTSSTCSSHSHNNRVFLRSPPLSPNSSRHTDAVNAESTDEARIASASDENPQIVSGHTSNDDSDQFDIIPKCARPKHKWSALLEYNRFRSAGKARTYRRKCYGNLFMVQRLELMAKLEGHWGCVNSVSFNPEGDLLVSGSDDLRCMLWDWQKNKLIVTFEPGHRTNIFQSKFMPHKNSSVIITSARDGAVRLNQLNESGDMGVPSRKICYHRGPVHKIAMHPALHETILSAGEDGYVCNIDIRLPNPTTLVVLKNANQRRISLYSIAINPLRPFEFITSGTDPYVRVFDRRNMKPNECVRMLCPAHLPALPHSVGVSCAAYNFDGTEILASYTDEDIYTFASDTSSPQDASTADKTYLRKYQGHHNSQTVKGVNYFGQRSEYIVSGSDCGYIFLWDKRTSHIVNFLYGDEEGAVNTLEPNPNAPFLATSGFDNNVKIWAPSADEEPKLEGLRENVIDNMRQRETVIRNEFFVDEAHRRRILRSVIEFMPARLNYYRQRLSQSSSSSEDDENPVPGRPCPTL